MDKAQRYLLKANPTRLEFEIACRRAGHQIQTTKYFDQSMSMGQYNRPAVTNGNSGQIYG